MKNLLHYAAKPAKGVNPNAPKIVWKAAPKRRPSLIVTSAAIVLTVGALAATFIIGGEQAPAAATATDTSQLTASVESREMLPTRKVRTTRIKIAPRPQSAEPQAAPVAAASAAPVEIEPLPKENARWARAGETEQTTAQPAGAERQPAEIAAARNEAETPADAGNAYFPAFKDELPDPLSTAAIAKNAARQAEREKSPAAETLASLPEQPDAVESEPTRTARVNRFVNMRSRPSDEAKSVMVVPAKASVAVFGCKGWCEVAYKGNRGWIYKSFIGEGGGPRKSSAKPAPAAAKSAPATAAAAPEPKAAAPAPKPAPPEIRAPITLRSNS
ncbi:MAG: SH3 domain-containing protein [Pseudaminobacter sp.]|nr:SH3 domain-containing protein [Pseudaminobacter sp.]